MIAFKINDIIDDFAKDIAAEIAQKRFYEIDEVKAIAKTRLALALNEILAASITSLEDQVAKLKAIYVDPKTTGRYKWEIGGKLAVANSKLKNYRKAVKEKRHGNEYMKLQAFLNNKFGPDVLNEFLKNINSILP